MSQRVRIQSDGVSFFNGHSSVIDIASGKQVPDVSGVLIDMGPEGISATLKVVAPVVDVVANAEIVALCPRCRR